MMMHILNRKAVTEFRVTEKEEEMNLYKRLSILFKLVQGWDSSVGMATRYGLEGPAIESRWGGHFFRTRLDRPWGPPSLLCNGYPVSFQGVKLRSVALTTHRRLAPRLEKSTATLYSPCGTSWPVLWRN